MSNTFKSNNVELLHSLVTTASLAWNTMGNQKEPEEIHVLREVYDHIWTFIRKNYKQETVNEYLTEQAKLRDEALASMKE